MEIQFLLEKDLDIAFNEVQSKVGQINSQLPDDAETPIISKIETGEIPIIWLALRGNRTLQDLSVYAKNTVKRKLETINGVGSVVIGGEQESLPKRCFHCTRVQPDIGVIKVCYHSVLAYLS